ncbi:MAG: BrnA antitoxin family protein [Magnetococcus sp. DMHC-1]
MAIAQGIANDPDTYELPDQEWAELRPQAHIGYEYSSTKDDRVSIFLSREVVERFRASGAGWQTRMDAVLLDWLKTHS